MLPAAVLAAPTPPEEDARTELARRALVALGVADVRAVADYFRLRAEPARALGRPEAAGEVERVEVAGLPGEWFLACAARVPRRVAGAALVSLFDSLVFEGRRRLEALFGLRYRLEIYVLAAQRRHGTTCTRSSRTRRSRPGSTSRRTAPRASSWCRPPGWRTWAEGGRRGPRPGLRAERGWPPGWGSATLAWPVPATWPLALASALGWPPGA